MTYLGTIKHFLLHGISMSYCSRCSIVREWNRSNKAFTVKIAETLVGMPLDDNEKAKILTLWYETQHGLLMQYPFGVSK